MAWTTELTDDSISNVFTIVNAQEHRARKAVTAKIYSNNYIPRSATMRRAIQVILPNVLGFIDSSSETNQAVDVPIIRSRRLQICPGDISLEALRPLTSSTIPTRETCIIEGCSP